MAFDVNLKEIVDVVYRGGIFDKTKMYEAAIDW